MKKLFTLMAVSGFLLSLNNTAHSQDILMPKTENYNYNDGGTITKITYKNGSYMCSTNAKIVQVGNSIRTIYWQYYSDSNTFIFAVSDDRLYAHRGDNFNVVVGINGNPVKGDMKYFEDINQNFYFLDTPSLGLPPNYFVDYIAQKGVIAMRFTDVSDNTVPDISMVYPWFTFKTDREHLLACAYNK
ncbi:hypothetical protein [Komagataeibacter oboediens]|uniref:hypothetical protein n=1 Tax=Komagataeibacter oboediens TaxID=65958 RepID=UPI0011B6539B|nr:hypothetical protein [Komagataeibacter oboediens]